MIPHIQDGRRVKPTFLGRFSLDVRISYGFAPHTSTMAALPLADDEFPLGVEDKYCNSDSGFHCDVCCFVLKLRESGGFYLRTQAGVAVLG